MVREKSKLVSCKTDSSQYLTLADVIAALRSPPGVAQTLVATDNVVTGSVFIAPAQRRQHNASDTSEHIQFSDTPFNRETTI